MESVPSSIDTDKKAASCVALTAVTVVVVVAVGVAAVVAVAISVAVVDCGWSGVCLPFPVPNDRCAVLRFDESDSPTWNAALERFINGESTARSSAGNPPKEVTTPMTRTDSLEFARKVPVFKSFTQQYFVLDVSIVLFSLFALLLRCCKAVSSS